MIKKALFFSAFGGILTFSLSISGNLFTTSILKALYATPLWFFIGLLGTWGIRTVSDRDLQADDESNKGTQIDISTPDDADITPSDTILQAEPEFIPVHPSKLAITDMQPEQIARAVRHLTDK